MSEQKSKSESSDIKDKLDAVTECSICTETFKEPKILACIHTFCKICLEKFAAKLEKSPGDEVPCPICRKKFLIPDDGFNGLQKNFFMENLIEMKSNLNASSNRSVCESCKDQDSSVEISDLPVAEVFCTDCQQKLCAECHKYHSKSKLLKTHRVVIVNEQQSFSEYAMVKTQPEVCQTHTMKPLDIYCSTCMEAVCSSCFVEKHNAHVGFDVESVVNEVQKKINEDADRLNAFVALFNEQQKKLQQDQIDFMESSSRLEMETNRSREEMRALVDAHSDSLLSELRSQKEVGLKMKESHVSDVEIMLSCLESFRAYCNQLMCSGSASSICRAVGSLNKRAIELEKLCDSRAQKVFIFPQLSLKIRQQRQKTLKEIAEKLIDQIEGLSNSILCF